MQKHIIVLLSVFVAVYSAQRKPQNKAAVARAAAIECDSSILANLDRCCDMPKLLQIEFVTNCFSSIKNMTTMEDQTTNCLVDCVLLAQKTLSTSGAIDLQKALTEFVTPVMNIWQPVVREAVRTCASELAAKMPTWTKVANTCNPRPALFMSCMGHKLALDCPSASKPAPVPDVDCVAKINHLRVCSPFANLRN